MLTWPCVRTYFRPVAASWICFHSHLFPLFVVATYCYIYVSILKVFTAAPPMAIGLFDRYCSADLMMQHPVLYKTSQNSLFFNARVCLTIFVVVNNFTF